MQTIAVLSLAGAEHHCSFRGLPWFITLPIYNRSTLHSLLTKQLVDLILVLGVVAERAVQLLQLLLYLRLLDL